MKNLSDADLLIQDAVDCLESAYYMACAYAEECDGQDVDANELVARISQHLDTLKKLGIGPVLQASLDGWRAELDKYEDPRAHGY